MSLLQISEPNQSPKPHQHRHAIGIDLGTTHSLVARVVSGKSEVLTINTKDSDNANSDNANSDKLLPSVVYYGNQGNGGNQDNDGKQGNPIVGKAAYQYAQQDPANTIISAKRFMGRTLSDIKFNHPYVLHGDNDTMPSFVTKHGHISPVQVSADILKTLADTATKALPKDSLVGAVITVPAYFDNAQRRATQDAAQTAGLTVLRLLNEPTAAAIAYGLDKSLENKTVLVYDLGGGTFDVSVLALKDGVFEVLATGGNSALGGDDIDRLLANYLIKQSDFTPSQIDNEQKQRLNLLAKGYKEQLSQDQDGIVAHFSLNQRHYQTPLNQQILAEIIKPVSDRTLLVSEQVLKDAQLSKVKLDAVILVGGSTRMPIIRQLVQDSFGKPPLCRINPDEVVAIGAAIFANQLINQHDDNVLLLDVTPLSLGLETMGGLVEVIIPRNTPIPIKKQQEFTTHSDGQTGMVIHVVQGERETVDNCRSLARFELFNIPPMKAGLARVQVVFAIDVNGQLTVSASEISTGVSASVHVVPSNGLSAEQQENLLKAGFIHAQADKALRMLIETKVEAERELLAIGSALAEFGDLLNHEQKTALITATDTLKHSLQSDDKAVIEKAVAVLKPVADHFASVIMNNSVKTALSGTHTDDW